MTSTYPPTPVLTLRSATDLIEAIPYLLGFHPRDSLVLVGLSQAWKVTITARMDLAESATEEAVSEPLGLFVRHRVAAVAIAVFDDSGKPPAVPERPPPRSSEQLLQAVPEQPPQTPSGKPPQALSDLPWSSTVQRVVVAARARGLTISDAALVSSGRWRSYLCRDTACCPPEGRRLAGAASETAAAATYAGLVAARDRAELVNCLAADLAARARLSPLLEPAEDDYLRAVLTDKIEHYRRRLKRAIFASARHSQELGRPVDAVAAGDADIAQFGVALGDTAVRDAVWVALDARRLDGRGLWQQMARTLPPPYDSPAAFLFGWLAWREGNATLAGLAAERALASNPGYTAAELLLGAVRHGLDPHRTPRLRRTVATRESPAAGPRPRGQPHGV